jgi:hypothetical protein
VAVETATEADPRRARPRFWLRIVAILVVVLALVALGKAGWWWTHPDLLEDHGDGMDMRPAPVALAARSAAVTFPEHAGARSSVVTFHGVAAVLDQNSARSKVSFVICRNIDGVHAR